MSDTGTDGLTAKQRREIRKGYIELIAQILPTHTITFNFGPWVSTGFAHHCMKGFCGRIERVALGRGYYKMSIGRLIVLGFPEHLDKNPHWHCVAHAPGNLATLLAIHSAAVWESLVPTGQIHWSHPRSLPKIQDYFTKEMGLEGHWDEVFVYSPDPSQF
jgi:hypothetical protein